MTDRPKRQRTITLRPGGRIKLSEHVPAGSTIRFLERNRGQIVIEITNPENTVIEVDTTDDNC